MMNKVPLIRPKLQRHSRRPAMLWSLGVALFVPTALGCVLAVIYSEQFDFAGPSTIHMSFAKETINDVSQEQESSQPETKQKLPQLPPLVEQSDLLENNDLLALELPVCEVIEWQETAQVQEDRLPDDYELGDYVVDAPKKPVTPKVATSSAPVSTVQSNAEIRPDKPVRYKNTPSLPKSINVNRIGKVDQVVKVVVSVTIDGKPSAVKLIQSSGNGEADRLFMTWVKEQWSFYPAEKDGQTIASKVVVPVRLNIN